MRRRPASEFRADVRVRHRGALVPATVRAESRSRAGTWIVETDTPVWAAAPGQAAVFYDGERCLGGGPIALAAGGLSASAARAAMIGPAPILAVIVGLFHVSAYVFIRGRAGARLPLLLIAAILGAWAGDTVAARMAIDPLRIGEFHLLTASFVAWLGIGLVADPRGARSRACDARGATGGVDRDQAIAGRRCRRGCRFAAGRRRSDESSSGVHRCNAPAAASMIQRLLESIRA